MGAVATSARRPTLADLAAAAGVSRTTASNAFNRPERLSAALRDRLLALAEEIGYAGPDPRAAGLRRGRVGAIGVVLADRLTYAFSDPAALQILDGIAEAVAAADTALLLLAGDGSGGGPAPASVTAAAVDGFVSYCLGRDDPALVAMMRRRLPAVFVDQSPGRTTAAVDLDEEGGVRSVTEHLLGLGHRRFGIVTLGCCLDVAVRSDRRRPPSSDHLHGRTPPSRCGDRRAGGGGHRGVERCCSTSPSTTSRARESGPPRGCSASRRGRPR